jgi:group II intron reverse transcriptase/maturase
MDMLWMREAFNRIRKDAAPGVDGVTVKEYAENLEANLADLLERAKSGRYRSSPTRRVHIPKNEKETRPISIPTLEDKVLQRAVAMLMEPICEREFLDCSYGFRPHRSTHQALGALRSAIKELKGGWVVDVDIKQYFDSIPHAQLKELLRKRINDSVLLRLIAKWLKAGALDGEELIISEEGTPQGGVISPMLSNIYLHNVLDVWFEEEVAPRLNGKAKLIRFADDFVVIFERLDDAGKFMEVLPKRFGKYGLEIHPDKTKLVDFCHPWDSGRKPGTFDFLGFTHYWGKTRKGGYAVQKKTSTKKKRAGLKKMNEWCKRNRHKPMKWQHAELCRKLEGHYSYYGVTSNSYSISEFRCQTLRIWRYWLNRRSRKRDEMSWQRFNAILKQVYPVPYARIIHKASTREQLWLVV